MIEIKYTLTEELISKATAFENFRAKCKTYLISKGKGYDKFTMVSHDSFIGYVTEHIMKTEMLSNYASLISDVICWEDNFDLKKIEQIIESNSNTEDDVNYVTEYFYDKWDLKINGKTFSILSDVKTALTKLEPNLRWNFLYPVVQANKEGKEIMILVYYVVSDLKSLATLTKLILVGATTPDIVKKCTIIKQGERTRFGTISQIDNYETELSKHYLPIETFLK